MFLLTFLLVLVRIYFLMLRYFSPYRVALSCYRLLRLHLTSLLLYQLFFDVFFRQISTCSSNQWGNSWTAELIWIWRILSLDNLPQCFCGLSWTRKTTLSFGIDNYKTLAVSIAQCWIDRFQFHPVTAPLVTNFRSSSVPSYRRYRKLSKARWVCVGNIS